VGAADELHVVVETTIVSCLQHFETGSSVYPVPHLHVPVSTPSTVDTPNDVPVPPPQTSVPVPPLPSQVGAGSWQAVPAYPGLQAHDKPPSAPAAMQLRMLASQVAALDVHFWYVAKHVSTYETGTFGVHTPWQLHSCGQPLVLGHASWLNGAGIFVGASEGRNVGASVGARVGVCVGVSVGANDGSSVVGGFVVGTSVGRNVGDGVGSTVGV
jgi:hypothetical protein